VESLRKVPNCVEESAATDRTLESPTERLPGLEIDRATEGQAPPRVVGVSLWALVVIGAVLRINCYLGNRSLWGDEASLAISVVWRSFLDLARPLERLQVAGLGFLWASKIGATILGADGLGVRLVPMLASVVSLAIVLRLACRILSPAGAVTAVALFAVDPWLITYAAEFKPYSVEVLAAALITLLLLRLMERPDSSMRLFALALASAAFVWFGAGAAFTAAGAWATLGIWYLVARRTPGTKLLLVSAVAFVCVNILASVVISTPSPQVSVALRETWEAQRGFPPPIWASWENARWYPAAALSFFENAGGLREAAVAAALFLVGSIVLWRKNRWHAAALLAPVGVVGVASLGHLYPLIAPMPPVYLPSGARLVLFLTPAMSLVIGAGAGQLFGLLGLRGRWICVALMATVFASPLLTTVRRAVTPPRFMEMRQAWLEMRDRLKPGDIVYVNWYGKDALDFYRRFYPPAVPVRVGTDSDDGRAFVQWIDTALTSPDPPRRIWLVFYQHPIWDLREVRWRAISRAAAIGPRLTSFTAPDVEVQLYGTASAQSAR
jgi:hypothetical protein